MYEVAARKPKAVRNGALTVARRRLLAYLETHSCVDCGEADPVVLEFDHRERAWKRFNVPQGLGRPWNDVVAEIAKCDVRCANCHRRRTAKQGGSWRLRAR